MPRNRYTLTGGIIVFLLLANLLYYCFSGWGLITVKVQDVPLSQVIKSIEWQGWVKICTNIAPDTKISMYVDHVPLPEALETLAINANGQWKLGFFVGPSSTKVKETIHSFEEGITSDTLKTYSYPTMRGMLTSSGEDDNPMSVGDPRLQIWPGMKAQIVPVSGTPPPPDSPTPSPSPDNQPAAAAPPASPDSMQSYLRTFAQAADIFIMSDSSWDPPVSSPPAANASIINAIKGLVSHYYGTVTQAFVLQARGQRGPGDGGRRGGFAGGEDTGWSMEDRVRNSINGLPEDARAGALAQLDQMEKLRQEMRNAPPDQRQTMRRQQMEARVADNPGGPMWRMSPDQRAQRYQKMVSTRMTAQGK